MRKLVIGCIAVVGVVFASLWLQQSFVTSHETSLRLHKEDSARKADSTMRFHDSLKKIAAIMQRYDDTLAMVTNGEPYLLSVSNKSYYNLLPEPHPEIPHRACRFFVDDSISTDSTLNISLFGTLSGGYPPGGTAYFRNDTLILLYWSVPDNHPAVGAYFKWSLHFEISLKDRAYPAAIVIVDRQGCYVRRKYFILNQYLHLWKHLHKYYRKPL